MFNFENVTNTRGGGSLQLQDVKIFAGSKVRIGLDARKKLGLDKGNHVLVQRDKGTEKLYIAGVDPNSGVGREVNEEGQFTHKTISHLLGGPNSVWNLKGEGTEFQGVNYFELEQIVDGTKAEKAELTTEEDTDVVSTTVDATTEVQDEI